MTEPIPAPAGYPILGNVLEIDPDHPIDSLSRIAHIHGPIFRLRLPRDRLFVGNYELAKELFDEKRFQKAVTGALEEVRNASRDGLFTAYPGEHNWEIAHRTLMPAFGPLPIAGMFSEMQDIVSQMVVKWARFGPDTPINVPDDFTRLTLDSIALCAMGTRFNSFYHEGQHPFVKAMSGMLAGSFSRARRPAMTSFLYQREDRQYQENIDTLETVARQLLEDRKANPTDKKDLLNAMILNKDPKTGETLPDDNIIRNMITFLIAGHETTSGLLSFLFYELLQNPEAYRKCQEEVDTVIGKEKINIGHMSKLPYIEACLRETLRLHPTAPAFTLRAKGDQVLGGRFTVKDGEPVQVLLAELHRDPEVYGPDAEEFRPSRMMGDAWASLPPNSWKPFGNGIRACIGRPFAWQESLLAVSSLLQAFQFTKDNPSYQLRIKTTLTIKPDEFFIRARLRDERFLEEPIFGSGEQAPTEKKDQSKPKGIVPDEKLSPILVLFGSNAGTCEALANSLESSAKENGFAATVKALDSGIMDIKQEVPVVIITSSYEGQPPDNAAHFVEWLTGGDAPDMKGIKFAVFGVGNKEWRSTYQKVPTLIDDALDKAGGEQIAKRAAVDVTEGNIFDGFDEWQAQDLWPKLNEIFGKGPQSAEVGEKELKLEIDITTRSSLLRQDVQTGEVSEVRLLTKPGKPRKRHIGIRLPTGTTYRSGDYLAVLPLNPPEVVRRVLRRYGLPWDATIKIDPSTTTSLPTGRSIALHDVLAAMVELNQPATNRSVKSLIKSIPEANLAQDLETRMAKEDFQKSNVTLLDLLEDYPTATFSIGQLLASIPPMRMRQYSISSTPLDGQSECSLTYSVIDAPSKGSRQGHRFYGVATNYMEGLSVGDHLHISLRPSRSGFHLPADDKKPIIMACAGTGLAPFHAFVAERAIKKAGGMQVGKALLFYGCCNPDEDDMYREEFDRWEKEGVVDVRRAYSGAPEASQGCKYVQHRIWHDRADTTEFFKNGAELYICGAGVVGSGVEDAAVRIRMEYTGEDEETAQRWVQNMKGERYWADIFA